jgi:hypothetical protein
MHDSEEIFNGGLKGFLLQSSPRTVLRPFLGFYVNLILIIRFLSFSLISNRPFHQLTECCC